MEKLELHDLAQMRGKRQGSFTPFGEETKAPPKAKPQTETNEPKRKQSPPEKEQAQDVKKVQEEAYARGLREGRKEAQDELGQTVSALAEAAERLEGLRSDLFNRSRDDLVRLVMLIAEQVIHDELKNREDAILNCVTKALDEAMPTQEHHVRVNPGDLDKVNENKPLFLSRINGLKHITVEGDESVSPGGCVVESDVGEVDATVETKLREIWQCMRSEETAR
jgi:flagellar assembly protein FliH